MAAARTSSSYLQGPPPHLLASAYTTPPSCRRLRHRAETSLPLTYFDIFWLHSPPVERLLFYRLAADADVATIISNLRDSFRPRLLPARGRIRLTPGTSDRYELHYQPGDAVTFTVAEYDDDDGRRRHRRPHRDEPARSPRSQRSCRPLRRAAGCSRCRPRCWSRAVASPSGVTVHHAACDGRAPRTSCTPGRPHAISGAEAPPPPPPPPPVIDRTLLPDPRGLLRCLFQGAPSTDELEFVKMSADQLIATFVLSKTTLERVKEAVADEAARRRVAPPRCPLSLPPLAWSGRATSEPKTKESVSGGAGAGPMACLLFAVDHRSGWSSLPDKYSATASARRFALAPQGELAAAGAAGLFSGRGGRLLHDELYATSGHTPWTCGWTASRRQARRAHCCPWLAREFRVYDLDFGFAPAKVDIVSVARTGGIGDGGEAGSRSSTGGMEVGVSLQPAGMERFRKCFVDAIAWLHLHRAEWSSHDMSVTAELLIYT
ncbi:LOW QUALITY PROTEIN: hypothetical protein BDA96_03G280000 [Sorghum bicolor]|uniref:Uncharacterized protein n=1 Tax=Sorghum bicolor TaxID=4558 RepID=A0A921RGU0_SORBI|nr:LOW QUALITY PROTEIN: hypothetical protein BDA96_03G280000 [Sorghum bicolor]